jgi:hypothetical protein
MTVPARRGSAVRTARAALLLVPQLVTRVRRDPPPQPVTLAGVLVLTAALTLGGRYVAFGLFPTSTLVVPLLVAGLLLDRPATRLVVAAVALGALHDVVVFGTGLSGVRPGTLVVLGLTAGVAYEFARAREETGLSSASGEGVLVELRRRLEQQGSLPALPSPWRSEALVSPAGGGPFAGDFVVSALTAGGTCLEVVLVDVSGKGVAAGTRALLLSGALGGLLGAVPPEEFLGSADDYLHRQDWDEGFATAVHVVLRLDDGTFRVASAGHPPPAVFHAGSGRWSLLEAEGPALGLLPGHAHPFIEGRLGRGDALLLYTDGLVEVPGRDLSTGIDKLLGEAERLVPRGFAGAAEHLVAHVAADAGDDRGLVLIWSGG